MVLIIIPNNIHVKDVWMPIDLIYTYKCNLGTRFRYVLRTILQRDYRYHNDHISLTSYIHLGSTAANLPVKFQSDWKTNNWYIPILYFIFAYFYYQILQFCLVPMNSPFPYMQYWLYLLRKIFQTRCSPVVWHRQDSAVMWNVTVKNGNVITMTP